MARTRRQMAVYNALKRRMEAQDKTDFAALFATPAALGNVAANATSTGVAVPANARLGASINAITVAGDISLIDGTAPDTHTVYGSGGAANLVQRFDVVAESRIVKVHRAAGCPAGNVSIYFLDEWELPFEIATAVFT